ncbi:porin family protein [Inquilinus sp. KBS0705]|nr:porin family protein [Inquilinus sp. KBS0705]
MPFKIILPVSLVLFAACANAQTTVQKAFGVGLELGAPSNSIYTIGFGGSGKAEMPLSSSISLTFTAGYTSFYYKNTLIGSASKQTPGGFIPLKAGLKYFFSQGVYVEAEGGDVIETNYDKHNLFTYAVGPGFVIPAGKNAGIDLGFRYESWGRNRLKQTGIRAAYRFGW